MESAPASRLQRWGRLFFFALVLWLLIVPVAMTCNLLSLQKSSGTPLPFGFFQLPNGEIFAQDFSYNVMCLRGIHEQLVARPYDMEEQERMVRILMPTTRVGMTHAYSPVLMVLAWPLVYVSGLEAYLIYLFATGGGLLLLFYFYLLPRATASVQVMAMAICAFSICTVTAFEVGQTAMLTTVMLGVFWMLLQRRQRLLLPGIGIDFAVAVLFWAICFKPSVAIVPFFVLLGAQAWRALILAGVLLLATWISLANYYGGWWTGLQDYSYLLNHYHEAGFTTFMQRKGESDAEKSLMLKLFTFDRDILLVGGAVCVFLRWTRRITLSELFQLMIWFFLLFSPYLLASEDWILCLLFVEGSFFKSRSKIAVAVKLILLACIFNLRANAGLPEVVNFPCKFLLFAWLVAEMIQSRRRGSIKQNDERKQ